MSSVKGLEPLAPDRGEPESLETLVGNLSEDLLGTLAHLMTVERASIRQIACSLGDIQIRADSLTRKVERTLVQAGLVQVLRGTRNLYSLSPAGRDAGRLVLDHLEKILLQHQQDSAARLRADLRREASLGQWLGKGDSDEWRRVGRCIRCARGIQDDPARSRILALLKELDNRVREVYSREL